VAYLKYSHNSHIFCIRRGALALRFRVKEENVYGVLTMFITLMDTYLDFKKVVHEARMLEKDVVDLWLNNYMGSHEELLNLHLKCHGSFDKLVTMANRFVRPLLDNVWKLDFTWRNIYGAVPVVLEKLFTLRKNFPDINIVIYVGSGCGAGWATTYNGKYSVLLGLEMMIYHKWSGITDVSGLLAHELCHILHMFLRGMSAEEFEKLENEPYFLLYSEGYAMKCEHAITNRMWRVADKDGWVNYCEKNKDRLARDYLETIEKGYPTTRFYSSWEDVNGYTQTGYYLGHEYIEYIMREYGLTLEEIAKMKLDKIQKSVIEFLQKTAYR
jgi:hypothetical protein